MIRIVLLISAVFLTNAKECALDSSGAVANAMDAALDIWASTERCKPPMADGPIKCEQDVASSIKSVSATAGAIAGMLASCGEIDDTNAKCGLAVNALVGATAGLAAASGEIADFCALHAPGPEELKPRKTDLGKCVAHSAHSINSLFNAKTIISGLSKDCPDGKKCTVDVLDVVSAVSDLGAHLAGSAAFCQAAHGGASALVTNQEKCTKGILGAVASLSGVAKIGMSVQEACSASATRLYLETRGEAATSSAILPITLAAALPIAAVLSVIAGLRLGKSRQHSSARILPTHESEELLEAPTVE